MVRGEKPHPLCRTYGFQKGYVGYYVVIVYERNEILSNIPVLIQTTLNALKK